MESVILFYLTSADTTQDTYQLCYCVPRLPGEQQRLQLGCRKVSELLQATQLGKYIFQLKKCNGKSCKHGRKDSQQNCVSHYFRSLRNFPAH